MSTEITQLPSNGDVTSWSDAEKAIVEAAGLVFVHSYGDRQGQREAAPRPVVEQFLSLARRSGLDPLARQIYCIGRLSAGRVEWSIQTGIDGFRLVAERSQKYDGQDGAEWLTGGGEWVDAFVPSLHGANPLAARVKVYRKDWPRPSVGVAEWGAYVQTKKNGELTSMWAKQGAGQLAKCAEALAIRKAFPQDLSGLYTAEEMREEVVVIGRSGRDWVAEIQVCETHEAIEDLLDRADDAGQMTDTVRTAALTRHGMIGRGEQPLAVEDAVEVTEAEPVDDETEYERVAAEEYAAAVERGEVQA
jgi:phage recombination protein Bet